VSENDFHFLRSHHTGTACMSDFDSQSTIDEGKMNMVQQQMANGIHLYIIFAIS